jgi:hypothetical protein
LLFEARNGVHQLVSAARERLWRQNGIRGAPSVFGRCNGAERPLFERFKVLAPRLFLRRQGVVIGLYASARRISRNVPGFG